MKTITINLRNKDTFLMISVIFFCLMLYSIHLTSWDIDLTSANLLGFYGFAFLSALFWWTPYQFINDFA